MLVLVALVHLLAGLVIGFFVGACYILYLVVKEKEGKES